MILRLLLSASLAGPTPIEPSVDHSARAVAQDVADLVARGELDAALSRIEEANAANPDVRYLYMRASLEEQSGRCSVAVPLYQEFLAASEDPDDRAGALAGLERCGAEAPPESAPTQQPEAGPTPAPNTSASGPNERVRPWTRDPVGLTLGGVGWVAIATGAGFWIRAGQDANEAERATRSSDYNRKVAHARTRERVGITLVAVGGVLLTAGIIRLSILAARGSRKRSKSVRGRQRAELRGATIFF